MGQALQTPGGSSSKGAPSARAPVAIGRCPQALGCGQRRARVFLSNGAWFLTRKGFLLLFLELIMYQESMCGA